MRVLWKAYYLGTLKCKDSPESYILHNRNCSYCSYIIQRGGGGHERIIGRHDFQMVGSKNQKNRLPWFLDYVHDNQTFLIIIIIKTPYGIEL